MAKFQEVMWQWRRMCKSMQEKNMSCKEDCPLGHNPTCGELEYASLEEINNAETVIMKWAAEHSTVYPTWEEYLISKGLLKPYWNENGTAPYDMYKYAEFALSNRISADTAQKLGIEPKEG